MRRNGPLMFGFALVAMWLASCGVVNEEQSSDSVAGGGIGGTGSGTVTGYGSVIVNDTRRFEIGAEARIEVDGEAVSESDLKAMGTGFVVRFRTGGDTASNFSSGTAFEILADHLVIGPVTGLHPLRVLGQTVVVTGDTVLSLGKALEFLEPGEVVAVSGYADGDNTILATRLELKSGGGSHWQLTGPVANLQPPEVFSIGPQWVGFELVPPRDCEPGLRNGMVVRVKAEPRAELGPEGILGSVFDLECVPPGLERPPGGAAKTIIAEVEGLVNTIALPLFRVGGQEVLLTGNTRFSGGGPADLLDGAKVEAEGMLDIGNNVLFANRLRFREKRVRIEAPVESSGGTINGDTPLSILGIPVEISPLARIEGGQIPLGEDGRQIEMRGFVDAAGRVFATRLRDKGDPDTETVHLRGSIFGLKNNNTINVIGIDVNTAGSEDLIGPSGESLSRSDFFSLLSVGSQVHVNEGRTMQQGQISGADSINIED